MFPFSALVACTFFCLVWLDTSFAAPTLVYDLQAQFPPVARVGQAFTFDFLPGTFTTNTTNLIQYSTSTLPSWLSFSSGPATFSGTPRAGDVGQSEVTVTASDGTGSTAATWQLVVTDFASPSVHSGFNTQIGNSSLRSFASVQAMPSNTGVQVPPYWSFSLGWQWDTFRLSRESEGANNGQLYVAARLRGTASLPSWLQFSNTTMTFTGVAPASGSYWITVTGTDFWGHTAAQSSFTISVGEGQAIEVAGTGSRTLGSVTGMARGRVEGQLNLNNVTIGGQSASADQLTIGVGGTGLTDWLSIQGTTLSGVIPDRYQNGTTNPISIPLTIASTNTSNTLTAVAYYTLNVIAFPFNAFSLPAASASPGDRFSLDLNRYLNNASSTTVNATVTPTEAADWLRYDTSARTLSGTVPSNPAYGAVNVTFTGTNGGYSGSTSMRLSINGVTATPSSSASPTPIPSTGGSGGGLSKAAKIGLGVGLGLLGLILLLLLLFCCIRRRRNRAQDDGNDNDSFVAGPRSPDPTDPFRKSASAAPSRNILSTLGLGLPQWHKSPEPQGKSPQPTNASFDTNATAVDQPQRVDGLKGIFGWNEKEEMQRVGGDGLTPTLPHQSSTSFLGHGDVIAVSNPARTPNGDMSSFTDSFSSGSGSRASWESERSFKWSSAENDDNTSNNRHSAASIARPRDNFVPRYPRSNSPSRLRQLTSNRQLEDSPEFSEFGSPASRKSEGFTASGSFGMSGSGSGGSGGAASGTTFPSGPSGLDRWSSGPGARNDSSGTGLVLADYDDEDGTDHEGPAVVKMAERQSFETRRPSTKRSGPRLKPSKERMTTDAVSAGQPRSSRALEEGVNTEADAEVADGMFDDADEQRRSRLTTYAPDPSEQDHAGLGYPVSAIYFNSPAEKRDSTIQAIAADEHQHPLSPPLPSVGSFVRPRPTSTSSNGGASAAAAAAAAGAGTGTNRPVSNASSIPIPDGRVNAMANETFSIHPQIHPPPTVSLSAATWHSAPPSIYRAELVGGGQLPSWLHFDSRELELWGVPSMEHSGDVLVIRIVEKMPREKRFSNPMAYGYQPPPEREVGKMTIEVTDRMKSPQFALENSPHAL